MKSPKALLFILLLTLFCMTGFADNNNWMSQIPKDRVFNQLIIPGTHNSGSNDIGPESKFSLAGDDPLPQWIEKISNILPISLVRTIVAGWSKTQPYSITDQLNNGIRYLDFRVCYSASDGHLYLCHALISTRLKDALQEIQTFTQNNSSEIIILDINHIYGVDDSTKEAQLLQLLQSYLGNNAIPNSYHLTDSIGTLLASKSNVMIFMDSNQAITDPNLAKFAANTLWHESNIDSHWPNASNITDLKNTLDAEVNLRSKIATPNDLFVLQTIQTESTTEVIDGILDPFHHPNTVESFEKPLNALLNNWLTGYIATDGAASLNIIIQDWFTNQSVLVPLAMQYDDQTIRQNLSDNTTLQTQLTILKQWYKSKTS